MRTPTTLQLALLLTLSCFSWVNSEDMFRTVLTAIADRFNFLTDQLMQQQLFIEERIRSEGDSGIKTTRLNSIGTENYRSASHTDKNKAASIHDHSNNIRTVGMGEVIAVLNGVEFRTRHNDFRLNMPHRTSTEYNAYQPIPFPNVPPEVTRLGNNIPAQIAEMREYFKAFKTQNETHRNYKPYFKPVLCYLEGGWTVATDSLDEPFQSDRHFLDASSWSDLLHKIKFTSYSGKKDGQENFAYLPIKIMENRNNTPIIAQWNYRIMCHPIQDGLRTDRFKVVDDLSVRLPRNTHINEHAATRAARFQLNSKNSRVFQSDSYFYEFLDDLMYQIPGKDNYPANIQDSTTGQPIQHFESDAPLNTGYYHRVWKVIDRDAMGLNTRRAGFNDRYLFRAQTTNERIAPMSATFCQGRGRTRVCSEVKQRWTYAIPLEIIYLTPLSKWNPYNFPYKGEFNSELGRTVNSNGKNGVDAEKAFDGINSKLFYQTPKEFFDGDFIDRDPADTTRGSVYVKGPNGVHQTKASGIRIFLPHIPGVGVIRQRYPIFPVHGEGSSVWKELNALKEIVLQSGAHNNMFYGEKSGSTETQGLRLKLGFSRGAGAHEHRVELNAADLERLQAGGTVTKVTTQDNGHSHELEIQYRRGAMVYAYVKCNGQDMCPDRHPRILELDIN